VTKLNKTKWTSVSLESIGFTILLMLLVVANNKISNNTTHEHYT